MLAGPGSGKTNVIVRRIAWLASEAGVGAGRILAVTFTNRAAAEMRARAERLLGDGAGGLAAGTFHSICARILRDSGPAAGAPPGFAIADPERQLDAVREAMRGSRAGLRPQAVLDAVSALKRSGMPGEAPPPERAERAVREASRVLPRYDRVLRASGALDFDDLLVLTLRLLERDREAALRWSERWRHLLVDELQDTSVAQMRIVELLAAAYGNVTAVGDPDQSIYGWRAADTRNIERFAAAFPDAAVVVLEQNYRSTGRILEAAAAVIGGAAARRNGSLWTRNPGGDAVRSRAFSDERAEADWIASEIARLARAGRPPDGCAVLCRSRREMKPLARALRAAGLPCRTGDAGGGPEAPDGPPGPDGDGVALITLHAAKGLEFPVVFMPAMEEGVLPHYRALDGPGGAEEERRLCYVGMTRAQERLYLTRAATRRAPDGTRREQAPSRFLEGLPAADGDAPPLDEERRRAVIVPAAGVRPGDWVRHERHGTGLVAGTDPERGPAVAFHGGGVRRVPPSERLELASPPIAA